MFTERAEKLRPGHSLKSPGDTVPPAADVGAMIAGDRFPGLQHAIRDAVDQGAVLTVGGEPWTHPYLEKGSYFKPTLLGDVNPDSAIAQSERECSVQRQWVTTHSDCSLRAYRSDHEVRDGRAGDRDCEQHSIWLGSKCLRPCARRVSEGREASSVRHGRSQRLWRVLCE